MPKSSPTPQAPTIRLPIAGGGSMQALLTGEAVIDGTVIVSGDLARSNDRRRRAIPDVFVGRGALAVEPSAHVLWVRVGNASFRTELEQQPSIDDFMSDVRAFVRSSQAANDGGVP